MSITENALQPRSTSQPVAMGRRRGRQSDHSVSTAASQKHNYGAALARILRGRSSCHTSIASRSIVLAFIAQKYKNEKDEYARYLRRSNRISLSDLSFNFNGFTDSCCLSMFRFTKDDLRRVVKTIGWVGTHTQRNRYACDSLMVTCVLLRRLTTPARWRDMEFTFGRHAAQLSEIFWEGLESFLETRQHLIMSAIDPAFIASRASLYAEKIKDKCHALDNFMGFIDGTVIAIARPSRNEVQNVAYNGHKRKHALKFQAVTTPDGLLLHAAGPIEGRRHDWTLYCRSGLDDTLPDLLLIGEKQYALYGDSGYSERPYLEIPFQGSSLTSYEKAYNGAMSKGRVTVEWYFKEVKLYWSTMDYKRKLRTGESPVGALYIAALLLTNIRNCVYPNTISQYFKCSPPTLEEYISHKDNQ